MAQAVKGSFQHLACGFRLQSLHVCMVSEASSRADTELQMAPDLWCVNVCQCVKNEADDCKLGRIWSQKL